MKSTAVVRRLHEHRVWVNEQLRASVLALDGEELKRPLAIGQGSLWKSLLHMYAAEYVWLACLEGEEQAVLPGDVPHKLPGNQDGQGGIRSLVDLVVAWRSLDGRWNEYLSTLSDSSLDDRVAKVSSNGKRTVTSRLDILLHVCTHAHYTAAQTVNMLRQLGVTPLPESMLITLARQQAAD